MFTNIDALPLGSLLQTSYGSKEKKKPEMPKIQNKGMVRKMMSNMPKKSSTFETMQRK